MWLLYDSKVPVYLMFNYLEHGSTEGKRTFIIAAEWYRRSREITESENLQNKETERVTAEPKYWTKVRFKEFTGCRKQTMSTPR